MEIFIFKFVACLICLSGFVEALSAPSRGERFALRCGSVHTPVPLLSAEVPTACRGHGSCFEGETPRVFAQPRHCARPLQRGEPEHRLCPGQLDAQAARAHATDATAAQPVPRPGCTALALRALLAARARVRPAPVGYCGSSRVRVGTTPVGTTA